MNVTLEGLNKAFYYVVSFTMAVFAFMAIMPLGAAASTDVSVAVDELALIATMVSLGIGAVAIALSLIRVGLWFADLIWGAPIPEWGKEKAAIVRGFQNMPPEKRQKILRRSQTMLTVMIGGAVGLLLASVNFRGLVGGMLFAMSLGAGIAVVLQVAYVRVYREAERTSTTESE